MENTHEELRAHLTGTDEEFRRLTEEHGQYHKELEALEAKSHMTEQDNVEQHRLKKLKLALKDQINEILARHKHAEVA